MKAKKFLVYLLCINLFVLQQSSRASADSPLPNMPKVLDATNIYAADSPNNLSDVVKNYPAYIYVPNTHAGTVNVIDQKTHKIIATHKVGREPQHVVPSWDLKTLWVNSDKGNSLTPIDPATGKFGKPVFVEDPYNLYFTPDGKYAVVMSNAKQQIVFRDPHSMKVIKRLSVPCPGINHADWSADGRTFVASCEFSGAILLVDTVKMIVLKTQKLPTKYASQTTSGHSGMKNMGPQPQDVKLSPDGKTYYIADMMSDGVWTMKAPWGKVTYLKTGLGAHGLYITRDSKEMLITNRDEGSISVFSFAENKLSAKWKIPGGGSPDMGGISADGKIFWISGRYNNVIYAVSTADGKLIDEIKVGAGPHGLCVYPQPGRYSLGHTGVFR